MLSGSAIANCQTNWLLAILSIVTVIVSSIWGKGIIKIIPVLLGVIVSYVIAACLAIILAFCPKFACLVQLMPAATIGGVSLILYGMISAVGVRNLVEEKVDLKSSRNVFVAALILVLAIGVKYGANDDIALGPIHLSGLAIAAIVGIFLNAIMPDKLGMKVKSFKGKEKS